VEGKFIPIQPPTDALIARYGFRALGVKVAIMLALKTNLLAADAQSVINQ